MEITDNLRKSVTSPSSQTLSGQKINRLDAHKYEQIIQNLLEKIDTLESKLKNLNREKFQAISKVKVFEEENDSLKTELLNQNKNNQDLTNLNTNYEETIKDLKNKSKIINEHTRIKFDSLNKDLKDRERAIDNLNDVIKNKDEEIKNHTVNNKIQQKHSDTYKEDLNKQLVINKKQSQKIRDLEKRIADLYLQKRSESTLLLEIEHLKNDNIRLVKMLNTTEQFHDIAYLGQSIQGGVSFIRPKKESRSLTNGPISSKEQRARSSRDYHIHQETKEMKKYRDSKNWVPNEAFSYLHDFKARNNLELSETVMNNILLKLNKIWQNRLQNELNRVKTQYQNEIKELNLKIMMQKSSKDVADEKNISNLKTTLMKTRDTLRDNFIAKNKSSEAPAGVEKVEEYFRGVATNMNNQKHLENENLLLKQKIAELQEGGGDKGENKGEFNQGSLWMIERCIDEVKKMEKDIGRLNKDYDEKVKHSTNSVEFNKKTVTDAMNFYTNSLKKLVEEIKKKMGDWRFDIQKNINSLKYRG